MLLVLSIAWGSCSASYTAHGCLVTTVKITKLSFSYSEFCISEFSVAVIRCSDQSYLREEMFVSAYTACSQSMPEGSQAET